MDPIALKERKKYTQLWKEHPDYRTFSPCDLYTPLFLNLFKEQLQKGQSVIDFGCGTGRSALYLLDKSLRVRLVDFCEDCLDPDIFLLTVGKEKKAAFFQECLWSLSNAVESADWILCFDTLEHIVEEKVDETLQQIFKRMNKAGLLSISLEQDAFGSLIGEPLHMTVKPAAWWREKLRRYVVIDQELDVGEHTLLVRVKKL